ncbi:MAG: 50S ribosomal protein L11 methyltransferase [Alphaproteobacteria bacterium]|nr:50S ribosomal protein L11 methyltransferase [Alphaproteobacteria bacterium]
MAQTWKVSTALLQQTDAESLADQIDTALLDDDAVVSAYEKDPVNQQWCVEIYFQGQAPDQTELGRLFGRQPLTTEKLPDTDWVSHSQSQLAPIQAGRFFVHGAHDRARRPASGVSIEIQAGQAFGTGHHGTTRGCLLALDDLLNRKQPETVLDVGCGSAVLAIAFALATKRRALASDVDPVAIDVAQANAQSNRAGSLVQTVVAKGTSHPQIRAFTPAQLAMANILAKPLMDMKADLAPCVAPGGCLILSGITVDQESRLLGSYRPFGLTLRKRWRLEGWSTLLLDRSQV